MFGTLEPDIYFWGERIEKIGPDKYDFTRAASPPACSRRRAGTSSRASVTINLDDYAILRERRPAREGRAGLLPAGALLSDSR